MRGPGAFAEKNMGRKNAGRQEKYAGPNRCWFDPMLCWEYKDWVETYDPRSDVRFGRIDHAADVREVVARHRKAWRRAGYTPWEIYEAAKKLGRALSGRRCA